MKTEYNQTGQPGLTLEQGASNIGLAWQIRPDKLGLAS